MRMDAVEVDLPGIYGLEHERRLAAEPGGHIQDLAVLSEVVHTNPLCKMKGDVGGFSLLNGSKHYVDSHRPDENTATLGNNMAYETATPETTSPRELRRYTKGVGLQAVSAIQSYLNDHPELLAIQYNHRASLGRDNVYGTQLNYGIKHQPTAWNFHGLDDRYPPDHFCQSIVNAVLVTGGGTLEGTDICLSQKIDGLAAVQGGWGNDGTIFQLPEKRGEWSTLQRLELRLADAHPGEQANYLQVGLGGIAIAVAQLPPAQLEQTFGSPQTGEALLHAAKEQNRVRVDADGALLAPLRVIRAADWTLRLVETFLELPRQGAKGEQDLVIAGHQILAICESFKQALAKQVTIQELAAKGVGWARRVAYVAAATSQKGIVDFARPECAEANAAYDLVRIEPDRVLYGPAFDPDNNLPPVWRLSNEEIAQAMTSPPADTVAAYRVRLMQEKLPSIYDLNWSRIWVWNADGNLDTIYTTNPLNPVDGR